MFKVKKKLLVELWRNDQKERLRFFQGSLSGLTIVKFQEDNKLWAERVEYYKKLIPPLAKG
jgi:hypothetical protein